MELGNEIAVENYRARFNWAFGIGSQGFSARAASACGRSAAPQRRRAAGQAEAGAGRGPQVRPAAPHTLRGGPEPVGPPACRR